jgi:hypothetical protein
MDAYEVFLDRIGQGRSVGLPLFDDRNTQALGFEDVLPTELCGESRVRVNPDRFPDTPFSICPPQVVRPFRTMLRHAVYHSIQRPNSPIGREYRLYERTSATFIDTNPQAHLPIGQNPTSSRKISILSFRERARFR